MISELVWILANCLRKKVYRKKRKNISEATIHLNSDMSKSILSFFKKSDTNSGSNVQSVSNPDDASHVNSVNNINQYQYAHICK